MSGRRLKHAFGGHEAVKPEIQFLWYDFWIGAFWDRKKRILYVCPLPCVVLIWKFPKESSG